MKRSSLLVLAFLGIMALGIVANELKNVSSYTKHKPLARQIALLFFFDKGLSQPEVWKAFLDNVEANRLFNVYLYSENMPLDSWWNRKKIPRKVPYTENSHMLIWQALIQEAQKNKQNLKFVVITEDSIPLKTPREVYETLLQNERSCMAYENAENDSKHFARPYGFEAHELWKNQESIVLNRTHAAMIAEDRAWVMRSHLRPYGQLYYPSTYLNLKGELNQVHNHCWTYLKNPECDFATCDFDWLATFEANAATSQLLTEALQNQALFAAPIAASFPKERLLENFAVSTVTLTNLQAQAIGTRIWQRECRGTVEGLTHWNKGEEFPSFGIGHFIWFPKGCNTPFQESFPSFLAYLETRGDNLPKWLKSTSNCPWKTREEFYQQIDSKKMGELRALLLETIPQQTLFICSRLEGALQRIQSGLSGLKQRQILDQYARLQKHPAGIEAMIDYMHFKGEGTASQECYKGQGWGLKQVLLTMEQGPEERALIDFVAAGKRVLQARVDASPPKRNEKRWLKGWHQRLEGYLKLSNPL